MAIEGVCVVARVGSPRRKSAPRWVHDPLRAAVQGPRLLPIAVKGKPLRRPLPPPRLVGDPVLRTDYRRHRGKISGRYRVFGPAVFRLYRALGAEPAAGAAAFATSATLPATPVETFADGTWFVAASWFNGVLDSGRAPLDVRGGTSVRLEIAGTRLGNPPRPPARVQVQLGSGGVVRVVALYQETGSLRAGQWALAYTLDGTVPAADAPTITREIPASGLAVLDERLPAQAAGAAVRVRVQVRRDDGGTWRYSADSTVLDVAVVTLGPSGPVN